MSIYGNSLFAEREQTITLDKFADLLTESTSMFDSLFGFVNEEGNELAVVKDFSFSKDSEGGSEKTKKSLIEWIKEMINKFITAVKTAFSTLAKKLHEVYMSTNVQDKIMSKNKEKMTYKNLQAAVNNGWPGLTSLNPVICKIADPKDSQLYSKNESLDNKYFDDIINSNSVDEAKEKYKEFKSKLEKFKSETESENKDSYIYSKNLNLLGLKPSSEVYFGCYGRILDNNKTHYLPAPDNFETTKKLAEEGEKFIKDMSVCWKSCIDNLKIQKNLSMNDMKSSKVPSKTLDKDGYENTSEQINMLYYKAKYEYSSSYLMRSQSIVKGIIGVIKTQHRFAITTYIAMLSGINKYAFN